MHPISITMPFFTIRFSAFATLGYWACLAIWSFPTAAWSQSEAIPTRPLAEKASLIFSDDFSSNRFGSVWQEQIVSAGVENGVMFGRQTTTAHGSVATAKLELPDGNLICECRFQLERNVTIAFEFDDMKYPDSVAGHIARVTIEPQLVKLHDDKLGSMNRRLIALRKSTDEKARSDAEAEMARHTRRVPMKLDLDRWYSLGVEIVGDQMRVTLDGKPIGYLTSAGLAHVPKPDLKISVSGKQALFDDLRIWSVR